jgi:hypothetical protein
MPALTLSASQVQQLNEWLYGGPTDPIGLVAWIEQNADTADPAVVYQAEGERDFYLLLLEKNGKQIRRQDITQKMADALQWVANSLDQWEALGIPIEEHQQLMRPLWNFIKQL